MLLSLYKINYAGFDSLTSEAVSDVNKIRLHL